jgi:hypothetical protein
MIHTNKCGCEFDIDAYKYCCGSCHCYCSSYDDVEIDSVAIVRLCDEHKN